MPVHSKGSGVPMSIVKPLSNGCENTSAISIAADSFKAASGVYSSWKWASAAVVSRPASTVPRNSAAARGLLFNVAAIDRDDVALPGVEFDPEIDLRLGERVVALLAHNALNQHLAGRVEHAQRNADGLPAVAEPAFAGDGI